MNEDWNSLADTAAARLREGFSTRVLQRAATQKRQRRELLVAAATLAACLATTGAITGWQVYREHEQNLAQWQELAAVTYAMERGL